MARIGHLNWPMPYGHIGLPTRPLQACLHISLSLVSLATFPLSLEHKAYSTIKQLNSSFDQACKTCLVQLHEFQELRNESYESARIDKVKQKSFHDRYISQKNVYIHQKVWSYNSKLKIFLGKLRSRWDDPYTILNLYDYGVVLIVEPKQGEPSK